MPAHGCVHCPRSSMHPFTRAMYGDCILYTRLLNYWPLVMGSASSHAPQRSRSGVQTETSNPLMTWLAPLVTSLYPEAMYGPTKNHITDIDPHTLERNLMRRTQHVPLFPGPWRITKVLGALSQKPETKTKCMFLHIIVS